MQPNEEGRQMFIVYIVFYGLGGLNKVDNEPNLLVRFIKWEARAMNSPDDPVLRIASSLLD